MSESAILWIIGSQSTAFLVLIGFLARVISAHTQACRMWQERFLVEHGKVLATQEMMLRRLEQLEKP